MVPMAVAEGMVVAVERAVAVEVHPAVGAVTREAAGKAALPEELAAQRCRAWTSRNTPNCNLAVSAVCN